MDYRRCHLMLLILGMMLGLGNLSSTALGAGSPMGTEYSTPRGESAIKGISEIIESAGELLLDLLKPVEEESTVESPDWNSLESPRHTLMTFLEAMHHVRRGREEAWPRVLATMGSTNTLDKSAQETAEALQEIFDRIGPIRAIEFPGPDQVKKNHTTRFEVFPYGIKHEWIWEKLGKAPEGKITLVLEASSGHWVFSAETLDGTPKLLTSISPIAPRYQASQSGQTFLDVFGPTFQRTPWWGWGVLLGFIVIGVFGGRLVKNGVIWAAQWLEKRGWETLGRTIRVLAAPGNLLVFTIALTFGLMFIRFTPTLSAFRWGVIELLLLATVGWLLFEVIDLVSLGLRKMFKKSTEYTDMAVTLVRRSLRVFAIVIFVIFVLQNVLGFNITALITGLGIVGLAISLAGKDSARNLFGALTVFLNRPFVVGDWIRFQNRLGVIEDVGMQAARVRLASGELLVVPNMQFIDHEVENLSLREYLRRELNLSIIYGTVPEKVDEALGLVEEILRDEEVVQAGNFDLENRPPRISFHEFGDYALSLKVYYWYFIEEDHRTPQRRAERGWFTYLDHCSLVNGKILRAFNKAGIEFAFPTQTLHWADEEFPRTCPDNNAKKPVPDKDSSTEKNGNRDEKKK